MSTRNWSRTEPAQEEGDGAPAAAQVA
jgi:hypothetical protein